MAKIIKIEQDPDRRNVYHVTFKKNSVFGGVKTWKESFKESEDSEYIFRQSGYYLRPDGSELGNGHKIAVAIDRWKRAW